MTATHAYFDTGKAVAALAHRGFSLDGLENSMVAFQAAIDLGFQFVETDAHATLDGVAVALHDASLDRTTDAKGLVSELDWDKVKHARIGGLEPVPLLEDVLGTWPHVRVNIDIKADSSIEAVVAAVEKTKSWDRVCVASFSTARRRKAQALLSKRVALSAGTREAAAFFAGGIFKANLSGALSAVDAVQVPFKIGFASVLTRRHVDAAKAAGKYVHVWTVNEQADMVRLIDLGVDGIVSDRADVLKQTLIDLGRWQS